MRNYGAIALGAITASIWKANDAFTTQYKAELLVERWMQKYSETRGKTTQDLYDEASRLRKISIFWDEEILQKVTNNLLTFWSIGEDVFFRAQKTALDLSTTLQSDLQSSTIMLGKALENPAEWLSALTRVWIKFTEEQENMINALVKSWDLLWAQDAILSSIEWLYWGASESAAKAYWEMSQVKKEIGDLREEIWRALRPAIDELWASLRPIIADITARIKENPWLVKWITWLWSAIAWLVAWLWTLGLAIPKIITWIQLTWKAFVALRRSITASNPLFLLVWAMTAIIIWGNKLAESTMTRKEQQESYNQQLSQTKELYDSGLISIEEYERKQNEIAIGMQKIQDEMEKAHTLSFEWFRLQLKDDAKSTLDSIFTFDWWAEQFEDSQTIWTSLQNRMDTQVIPFLVDGAGRMIDAL